MAKRSDIYLFKYHIEEHTFLTPGHLETSSCWLPCDFLCASRSHSTHFRLLRLPIWRGKNAARCRTAAAEAVVLQTKTVHMMLRMRMKGGREGREKEKKNELPSSGPTDSLCKSSRLDRLCSCIERSRTKSRGLLLAPYLQKRVFSLLGIIVSGIRNRCSHYRDSFLPFAADPHFRWIDI